MGSDRKEQCRGRERTERVDAIKGGLLREKRNLDPLQRVRLSYADDFIPVNTFRWPSHFFFKFIVVGVESNIQIEWLTATPRHYEGSSCCTHSHKCLSYDSFPQKVMGAGGYRHKKIWDKLKLRLLC